VVSLGFVEVEEKVNMFTTDSRHCFLSVDSNKKRGILMTRMPLFLYSIL